MFNGRQPIIWAIDALYSESIDKSEPAVLIESWIGEQNVKVEPVFVCNDIQLEESWAHSDAYEVLQKIYKDLSPRVFAEPHVIRQVTPPFGTRKQVQALLNYCQEREAQLIVVHSTNKPAAARMVLGSFAETLIHSSSIPVLLLPAGAVIPKKIERVLFATDFSAESYDAFKQVMDKARNLNARVSVYSQNETWAANQVEQEQKVKAAEKWKKYAQNVSVETEFILSHEQENKAEGILKSAIHHKVDMLALVSRTGRIGRLLLGSTTTNLARRVSLPLLILYPNDRPAVDTRQL